MSDPALAAVLVIGVIGYLLVGLAPFSFDFTRPGRIRWFFVTPWNGVLNWACFVPLGYALTRLFESHWAAAWAIGACALLSLAVEALQRFIPGRFCCVSDWLLNTAGAATGAGVAVGTLS